MIKRQYRSVTSPRFEQVAAAALGLSALVLACLVPLGTASATSTLTTLYRFQGPLHSDGQFPATSSGLVRDAFGVLYGTTEFGGTGNFCQSAPHAAGNSNRLCGITKPDAKPDQGAGGLGTVFRLAPPDRSSTIWREQVIHSFLGGADGEEPIAGLVRGERGVLYGTTPFGGNDGTVYMLTPPLAPNGLWSETILHPFAGGPDGALPFGGLLLDRATGTLYGTTAEGGENGNCDGCGTVYQLTPNGDGWTESIIYSLQGFDGGFPLAGLLRDRIGALWTTAEDDGTYGQGSIFRLTLGQAPPPPPPPARIAPDITNLSWNETTLYSFPGYLWSSTPGYGAPIQIDTGEVIGTTVNGGDYKFCQGGCGTVYKMIPPAAPGSQWIYRVIHRFHGGTDGAAPWAGLIKGPGGVLYGTTMGGGNGGFCTIRDGGGIATKTVPVGPSTGCGTIYKLTPPPKGKTYWPETVLYRFKGRLDGGQPLGAVLRGPHGELFGTTSMGGLGCPQAQGCGTVFMLQP